MKGEVKCGYFESWYGKRVFIGRELNMGYRAFLYAFGDCNLPKFKDKLKFTLIVMGRVINVK